MIVVRLPAILRRPETPIEFRVDAPVETIDELVAALDRLYPGLAMDLDDSIYNFAINDAIVLHQARRQPLHDGDVVEVIPAIAGG
jgi:molybdopterin converting factor small subunit